MSRQIVLAGGCFWGVEKFFSLVNGVVRTEVGYANGKTKNPSYEDVCRKNTGHAEAIWIEYEPKKISLAELLELFYKAIDPISVNKQGNDIGEQYRTGIYYIDEGDVPFIQKSMELLQNDYKEPVAIEMEKLDNYSPAEDYHQDYLKKNPNGYCHIGEKQFKLAKSYRK